MRIQITSTNIFSNLIKIFFVCTIISCSTKEKKHNIKANKPSSQNKIDQSILNSKQSKMRKNEDWIYDTIFSIEEVQKENEYLVKQTKGDRNLSVVIYSYPNAINNYYWIKVWEDNDDAYATHFNFYVYTKTRKIMFYDTVNDTLLELQVWKKDYKYFNFK
jgi:hypothetical protein